MSRAGAGRWIAAGAGLAAALAACVWIAVSMGGGAEESDAAGVAAPGRPARGAGEVRHAANESDTPGGGAAVVEIDDAPLPEGATGTIRGTVRDDLGQPVQGAWVSTYYWRAGVNDHRADHTGRASASDGTYTIEELDPSIVWGLEANADGHASVSSSGAIVFSARRLGVTRDLVLRRNGSVDVVALDAAGAPVQHNVRVMTIEGDDSRDADARSLAPGRYRVFVEAPGRAGDSRVVDIAAGEVTRAEFRLDEAVEISGVVVDADGTPVRRVEVVAVVADVALSPFDGTAESAADGSFRIGGLRRTRYRLAVADPESPADAPEPLLAPATGATLRLREESKVTFRLVYPAGFPPAERSAEVGIGVSSHGRGHRRPSPHWDFDQATIRVPGGEEVDISIVVLHCATLYRHACVRPGESLDLGDICPELVGDVAGRVVDASGEPVDGASVTFRAGPFEGYAQTQSDGRFLIERVPPSGGAIDVDCSGYVRAHTACGDAAAGPMTVTLVRGGVLWLRGEAKGGTPLARAALRVAAADGNAWPLAPAALDDSGECATRLPPGRWRIAIAGCAPVDADVRENATTSVRVQQTSNGR